MQTEIPTSAYMKMENQVVTVNIFGRMDLSTRGNSRMGSGTVRESGQEALALQRDMREILKMIKRMVKVYLLGLMGINMRAVIRMISGRVLVICYGMMVASTEVNGRMEFKMERGN